jgi:hypothetical protein
VAALRALPDSQRETLALHYLADLPIAEVAKTLGVPPPTEELARCDVAALTCTRIDEIPAGAVDWAYPPQY